MNPILKDNFFNNKIPKKRKTMHENIKILDKIPKKNLPELRLTKLKMRPGSDPETENNGQNTISIKTGLKYTPLIPKIQKNHALIKKSELMFPKIKNEANNNFNQEQDNMIITNYNNINLMNNNKASSKRKNLHSRRNSKTKNFYGCYGINNNFINNVNNINSSNNHLEIRSNLNEKVNDNEKNSLDNYKNNNKINYMINLHKVKSKIPKYPRNNKSMPSRIPTKIKKMNKEHIEKNIADSLTIKPLINYPKNNNYLPSNYISNNNASYNINKIIGKNNNISNNSLLSNIPNQINSNNTLNDYRPALNPLPTPNGFTEYELMAERINNLFSSFISFPGAQNPFYDMYKNQKTVELSPEIFKNNYKNFIPSTISSSDEFNKDDIIKGYAYNSSMGNIRDYNEDTITATKVTINKDNYQDNFYFFGVYDGHGGSGCSLYLKNNLHNYVKDFSKESIKDAIYEIEDKFLKNEALDEKGEIKDPSGSCGIIAMIQNNKCIISNVGDSRLVVYKNNSVFFCTEDHKPGSNIEKERIEKAGGNIYKTPSIFPLFQNGKEIEIPWRVFPGRLSVSRTFGDIEAKEEKFGGNKNVVVALPDITEIELGEELNFIVLGCDGIFDVLSNEEILECIKIVLREKNIKEINENVNISELCGDFAEMIIKSSLAKDSFDNVSCIVIVINIKDLINNC